MSRSIHWTYKIFKHKSKRELSEMCDGDTPDYAVAELRKKMQIKQNIRTQRMGAKIEEGFFTHEKNRSARRSGMWG